MSPSVSPDSSGFQALFFAAVPYVPGVARVVIREGSEVIVEATASATPPTVTVLAPNGGEEFLDGTLEINWEATDADGDALTFVVQYSSDDGVTWVSLGMVGPGASPSISVEVENLIPSDSGRVRVLVSDGIHQGSDFSDGAFSVGTTGTGSGDVPEEPTSAALLPAYPNPSTGSVVIPFRLPSRQWVALRVYDLLGREVRVLLDGEVGAGLHEVRLDARGLAGGVYLVKMEAEDHREARTITLVR